MSSTRGLHPQSRVEDFTRRGWWTEETIDGLFGHQVSSRRDLTAIVDPANRMALVGTEPRRLTWGELDSEVTSLAARLHRLGLRRGDVVGAQMPNTIEFAELYLAAWSLGVVVSPIAVQYREHEILTMASQAELAAFVTVARFGDRRPAAEVAALRDRLPGLRHVLVYECGEQEPTAVGDPVVAELRPAPADDADRELLARVLAEDPNRPNDAVTICWTSGTERAPKGVPRCHADWLAQVVGTVDAPRLSSEDVLLNPFPMINMAGISGLFLPWLRTGGVLVQHHPFDLPTFLGQIQAEQVSYTVAPPALLWMLLHNEELLATVDLSSLTRIGSGSAPLQPDMVRGWQERHGIGVINFFGSNEGVGLLSAPEEFPDPEERARYFPRYGAEGAPWTSRSAQFTRTRLVDVGTGAEVTEPGRSGVLHISSPAIFAGYLNGSQAPAPFDEEGYLISGDVFEIAGDRGQFLRYLDRAGDLIIRGGMNIAPAELEALIGDHPAVADVAVIGDPDEMLGERVAAVVTLHAGTSLDLAGLVEFLREQRIASFKLPERLEVRDVLPRNPVGKVLKRALRSPAPAEAAPQ